MADRNGLRLVGFIFASVTLAVMVVTTLVVTSYAGGGHSPDTARIEARAASIR